MQSLCFCQQTGCVTSFRAHLVTCSGLENEVDSGIVATRAHAWREQNTQCQVCTKLVHAVVIVWVMRRHENGVIMCIDVMQHVYVALYSLQ